MRITVTMFAFVLGCGASQQSAPTLDPEPTEQTAPTELVDRPAQPSAEATEPSAGDPVQLLDAGAEPLVPVRYRFEVGATARTLMEMEMRVDVAVNGALQPPREVHMRSEIDANVISTDGGVFTTAMQVRLEMLTPPSDPTTSTVEERSSDRGRRLVEEGQKTNWMLPVEPIGVGARWRFRSTVSELGMTVAVDEVCTLDAISSDGDEVHITCVHEAPLDGVSLPEVEGLTFVVDSGTIQTNSRSVVRLDRPLVTGFTTTETNYRVARRAADGSEVRVEASGRTTLTLSELD